MNEQETLQNIAKRLIKLRKKAGYKSYETFAFDHDIPRQQYWRMERGENMTVKTLMKILKCHSMTIEEFFKLKP